MDDVGLRFFGELIEEVSLKITTSTAGGDKNAEFFSLLVREATGMDDLDSPHKKRQMQGVRSFGISAMQRDAPRRLSERTRPARSILVAAALSLLVLGSLTCGGSTGLDAEIAQGGEVNGAVVRVESPSLLVLTSLDVRDAAGHTWHFQADGYRGLTPSHLREHMVQGLPVTVRYHTEDGLLVADEVTD